MSSECYRLIAYEVETGTEVLDWSNVAPTHRYRRGDILKGDDDWEVVGVRDNSTEELWVIDVRKVVRP